MKRALLFLTLFLLSACETVISPDGTKTTHVDSAAIGAGLGAYEQYDRSRHPNYIIGIDPVTGLPIYGTR